MRICTIILSGLAVFWLAACAASPSGTENGSSRIELENSAPIDVNVASVDVVNETRQALNTPRDFYVSLDQELVRFLKEDFRPRGLDGAIEIAIKDVSVKHEEQPSDNSFAKMINMGGYDVYDMTIEIELRRGAESVQLYEGRRMRAHSRLKMSEHLSPVKRENQQTEAVKEMLLDLKSSLEKTLLEYDLIMPVLTTPEVTPTLTFPEAR